MGKARFWIKFADGDAVSPSWIVLGSPRSLSGGFRLRSVCQLLDRPDVPILEPVVEEVFVLLDVGEAPLVVLDRLLVFSLELP